MSAVTMGLQVLAHLAQDKTALSRLLSASGLAPADLRARAGDPELLAAVLDFLLADDALLTGFCESEGITPYTIHLARRALPGAADG